MTMVAIGVVGVGALGSAYVSSQQRKASDRASQAQSVAAQRGIAEERRQFDEIKELLSPYVSAGNTALTQQLALIGLAGDEAQSNAIQQIERSPQFEAITRQGEEAIIQNASATGGLRGGNTQAALSQYRPQVLSGLIESRYNQLGGLANVGQASAAGVGAAGQQTSGAISGLLQQQGAAQAGAALAQGQAQANLVSGIGSSIGAGLGVYNSRQPSPQSIGPYRSGYKFA